MLHDLRFALRRIRMRPAPSAIMALTLGLGIGAALAVFAVVDAVLLRPLPYENPGRLVRITQTIPVAGLPELNFADVGYRRLGSSGTSLAAVAAYDTRDANLLGQTAPQRLIVARVSATLFDVLRVRPAIGRGFAAAEDVPGAPRVVVLSDALWRSSFGADTGIAGRVTSLEGEPYTIVGVLPPEATFPSREIAAWEPLRLDPAAVNPYNNRYAVVGRLRDGATPDQAALDLTAAVRELGREFPGPHPGSVLDPAGYFANVRPLGMDIVGDARPIVVLLLGGVVMLLLLTCANVVNLQLAGVIVRAEELAVRAALGATRARLVRGAVLEGMVLTAAGALLGVFVAVLVTRLMSTLLPAGIAGAAPFGGRMVVAAALVVLCIGALVGALPVAVATRRDPARGLHERGADSGPAGAARLRRVLASAQVALAILLLHGAGLLIASARQVQRVSLGFEPASSITMRINMPVATFGNRGAREALLRGVLAEVGALPGVAAAGVVNALPLTPGRRDIAMAVEGRPFRADGTDPLADYRVASAGYFAAMGIELVRGRTFSDDDATASVTPLVISEGLARQLFPDGEDPIGRRLRFGPMAPWMPIIGVVADAKNRSLTEEPRPELYTPALGSYSSMSLASEITLVTRTRGDAIGLAAPIRRIVQAAAPDAAIYEVKSLGTIVDDARERMTTVTRLMAGYALAALLLAIAGTYAVLAYLVSQRRRELAVRMALGATPRAIVILVLRESGLLVGAGVIAGLLGALLSSRLLAGLLYGVGTLDLAVVAVVVVSASAAGLLAAWVPARRAVEVDPGSALRGG